MSSKSWGVWISLTILSALFLAGLVYQARTHPELFVTYDFLAYHSSFQLFIQGIDPYNAQNLLQHQTQQSYVDHDLPAQMRYAPWTFPMMAPVLTFDLLTAAVIWFCCSVLFMLASSAITWKSVPHGERDLAWAILAGALFVPNIDGLAWNQIGFLITLGIAGLFWSLVRGKDIYAGVFLAVISLKPHLFLPLGLALLAWILLKRRFAILYSCLITIGVLLAAAVYRFPSIVSSWLSWTTDRTYDVSVPSVVGLVRSCFFEFTGIAPYWPMALIPGLVLVSLLAWLVKCKGDIDWGRTMPWLLGLSLAAAPFINIHDLSILLINQVVIVARLSHAGISTRVKGIYLSLLVLLQAGFFMGLAFNLFENVHFAWLSIALLLLSIPCPSFTFSLHGPTAKADTDIAATNEAGTPDGP